MRRLIYAFVVRIWYKQVFSWCSSYDKTKSVMCHILNRSLMIELQANCRLAATADLPTLCLLYHLHHIFSVQFFQINTQHINSQACVTTGNDPVSQQSQGWIHVIIEVIDLILLVPWNMRLQWRMCKIYKIAPWRDEPHCQVKVYMIWRICIKYEHLSRSMTKSTNWHVSPVKIDQPGILTSLIRVFTMPSLGS